MASNPLPEALKAQLLSLGAWSMQYSTRALLQPLALAPLIEVNRNIADGLAAQRAPQAHALAELPANASGSAIISPALPRPPHGQLGLGARLAQISA